MSQEKEAIVLLDLLGFAEWKDEYTQSYVFR